MKEVKRVLCLQEDRTFRRPRSWNVHVRYAILAGGQEMTIEAGTWLLELGATSVWAGGDRPEVEYLYRFATGTVVALDRSLTEDEAVQVTDPQVVAAMNAFRTLEGALLQDHGIALEAQCRHLPPFALIKCPLCGGAEFTSLDLASAWCDRCNVQFTVRPTAGDPGFVVDARWSHYSYLSAKYILPRTRSLYLCLVLKDSLDPRDMTHDPDGGCWSAAREGKCRPDAPWLTGDNVGLRPGLHSCNVGTLYDWDVHGRVPMPGDLREDRWSGWKIDGQWWPNCATVRALELETDERRCLEQAAAQLGRDHYPVSGDLLGQLARISKEPPVVFQLSLPPMSALQEGDAEAYLLHHWVTAETKPYLGEQAWPVWYVVRPVADEHGRVGEWEVVRRDICPRCNKPTRPEDLVAEGEGWDVPHGYCRDVWQKTGWQPQFNEVDVGELAEERRRSGQSGRETSEIATVPETPIPLAR